jgi:hypothetical protein
MADWGDLKAYIKDNYTVSEDYGDGLTLEFRLRGGRAQMVSVSHRVVRTGSRDTEHWCLVESPFGVYGEVDLRRALTLVGNLACGGVGMYQDFVTLRDAIPLENLDLNEFERPLLLITASADDLEGMLTGNDEF